METSSQNYCIRVAQFQSVLFRVWGSVPQQSAVLLKKKKVCSSQPIITSQANYTFFAVNSFKVVLHTVSYCISSVHYLWSIKAIYAVNSAVISSYTTCYHPQKVIRLQESIGVWRNPVDLLPCHYGLVSVTGEALLPTASYGGTYFNASKEK